MAETMDDTFKARVDKIFGSLKSSRSAPSPHQQPPLWSLSDAEVEKKEWRRETGSTDRDEMPCSSSFEELLREGRRTRGSRSSREQLDEEEEDDGGGFDPRRTDGDTDEWEIRSSIGLDRTLDNEEEEDTFDKVASGREYDVERLYMGDVTDHGGYLNSHNVLESALPYATKKDPRANYMAARIRLNEDDVETDNLDQDSGSQTEIKNPVAEASDIRVQPRSILKRKNKDAVTKTQKRVRFDPSFLEGASERPVDHSSANDSDDIYELEEEAPGVPDYLLHPSRYTRYTFDSSTNVDEESDRRACLDSEMEVDDVCCGLPKSVTFVPKKKASDVQEKHSNSEINKMENGSKQSTGVSMGIAAGEEQMLEDDAESNDDDSLPNAADTATNSQKSVRSYRRKPSFDPEA